MSDNKPPAPNPHSRDWHPYDRGLQINAAAGLEDPALLIKALDPSPYPNFSENDQFYWYLIDDGDSGEFSSPIMAAIENNRLTNLRILLDAGLDPNGFLPSQMKSHMEYINRGWEENSEEIFLGNGTADDVFIPDNTVIPFWASVTHAHYLDDRRGGEHLHSLAVAAKYGNINAYRMLSEAGADNSAWREALPTTPSIDRPSSLAMLSPVHLAILYKQTAMLKLLLEDGLNPNCQSNTLPQMCLPMQACFWYCDPPNVEAFEILSAHPHTRSDSVTEWTWLHTLHFVVARCSHDPFVQALAICPHFSLKQIRPSRLGQSLLHVACLPPGLCDIQLFGEKCYRSVRITRQLKGLFRPSLKDRGAIKAPSRHNEFGKVVPLTEDEILNLNNRFKRQNLRRFPVPDTPYFTEQQRLVMLLISYLGPEALTIIDIEGNTPLHYLAAYRILNVALIDLLRTSYDVALESWLSTENKKGFKACELFEESNGIREEEADQKFWSDHDQEFLGYQTWPPSAMH